MAGRISVAGLVLFLVGAATSARADVGGVWQPYPALQIARQEVAASRIGSFVYVAGGLLAGPTIQATATVERFGLVAGTWVFVAPLPAPRDHLAMCQVNNWLYAIGGYAGDFTAKSDVWLYQPILNNWMPMASLPSPRGACCAVALGTRIFVFGGTDASGSVVGSTFVFDVTGAPWNIVAPMPTPREHLTGVAFGSFIYVIGGRNASGSLAVNERYDPLTNQWTTLAPMPTARSATATAILGQRIFVMGGEVPVLSDRTEVYDVASNTWSTEAPMPIPRHGVGAVALDDRVLLAGGGVVQGLQPTNQVDAFLPLAFGARHACACASGAPCGNASAEAGCANSLGTGAVLTATGQARVSADTLVLRASAMPTTTSVLFFQGTVEVAGGAGAVFGDGKRCAGGTVIRFGIETAAGGSSTWPGAGDPTVSQMGLVPAGATRTYQAWYRNVAGPCGSGFNLTNGVTIDWAP